MVNLRISFYGMLKNHFHRTTRNLAETGENFIVLSRSRDVKSEFCRKKEVLRQQHKIYRFDCGIVQVRDLNSLQKFTNFFLKMII